jgi:hypothetical protein
MNYIIENEAVRVTVADMGAELMSLVLKSNNTEYLWQGDEKYWTGRATNLFPICGRLTDGKYTYQGNEYEMVLHGFAKKSVFSVIEQKKDSIVFSLRANEETLKIYPFDFELFITYTLCESTVRESYRVINHGLERMYFALGGHPGFNLPLEEGCSFEDYFVAFAQEKPAKELVMEACYMTEETVPARLKDGKVIELTHSMFDKDAIFLQDMDTCVTLKAKKGQKSVTLRYPDMKYLGLWHKPKTAAPYVCIEPWLSVPAYYQKVDDLETKRDMLPLEAGASYETYIEITLA